MFLSLAALLTTLTVASGTAGAAAPDVDCDAVVWSSNRAGTAVREIYVADASDGRRRNLTRGLGITTAVQPGWASVTSPIHFLGDPAADGSGTVHGLTTTGGLFTPSPEGVPARGPAVSTDWIAWFGDLPGAPGTLHVSAPSGEARRTIGEGVATAGGSAAFSPSGDRVAWLGNDAAGERQLYVAPVSADGSGSGVLAPFAAAGIDAADIDVPAWSPDGTRVLLVAKADGRVTPWVIDLERDTVERLAADAPEPDVYTARWSPDGTRVVWDQFVDGARRVVVGDADGRSQTTISGTAADERAREPHWSPDGRWIAWLALDGGGKTSVVVVRPDGRELRTVSPAAHDRGFVRGWTSDSAAIVWTNTTEDGAEVFAAAPESGDAVELSDLRIVAVPGPIPIDDDDPEDALDVHLAGGVTELGTEVVATTDAVSISVANRGPCDATPFLVWPRTCDIASPDAVPSGGSSSLRLGRLGPDETRRYDLAVGAGGCSASLRVVATNTAPSVLAVDIAPRAGEPGDPIDPTACATAPTPFTDIAGSFAEPDIACIYGLGITTGTSPTTYSPQDPVTREQMAAFLARLWRVGEGDCASVATPFTDTAGSFAAADIGCIFGLGITTGTSPTTYSPQDPVTREQMAAFLARFIVAARGDCPAVPSPFDDVAGSFAADGIDCIYGLGITTGTSPTTYSPKDPVTREQMAAFLTRSFLHLQPAA